MSPLWTVSEIVNATGGRPEGLLDGPVGSISIDSREPMAEALFVAIKGESRDGHDFVPAALEAGAAAALVSEEKAAGLPKDRLIVVPDPLKALEALARTARTRSRAQFVAVTGSVGKTSTKEALRVALSALGRTHASVKSYNNHWGVPLMLASMPREAQFGVFEIGMNHAGEITPLVKMVRPHIVLITSVAPAHLAFFPSVNAIAEAKAEIFLGLEPGGVAVLNTDHDWLHVLMAKARQAEVPRVVTYGFDDSADWHIAGIKTAGSVSFASVVHAGKTHELALKVAGRHMLANAVAALAVADLSGEGTARAIVALANFSAPEGRGEVKRLGKPTNPLLLVDESYNANTASMRAAMEVYAGMKPPSGQKVLVLGDMLELGEQGPALHASLADAVVATGATRVYLVGPTMAALRDALGKERVTLHAESVESVAETLLAGLAYGDAIMVKGSKGVRLAGLVNSIREKFA